MKLLYIETSHLLLQVIFFPLVSSHPINFLENFIFFSNSLLKIQKTSNFAWIFFITSNPLNI